jgi:hypothetical protein
VGVQIAGESAQCVELLKSMERRSRDAGADGGLSVYSYNTALRSLKAARKYDEAIQVTGERDQGDVGKGPTDKTPPSSELRGCIESSPLVFSAPTTTSTSPTLLASATSTPNLHPPISPTTAQVWADRVPWVQADSGTKAIVAAIERLREPQQLPS